MENSVTLDSAKALLMHACVAYALHKYSTALKSAKTLLKLYAVGKPSDKANAYFYAAKCEVHLNPTSSIQKLEQCLDLDSNHYGASIFLANLLVSKGYEERSMHYYANAIRIKPEQTAPHFGLMLAVKRFGSENATV